MARQLTIRGVPEEVSHRLAALSREKEQSINATVVEILEAAVGYEERRRRLERYATWTDSDRLEFESNLEAQRHINDADWS